MIYFDIGCNVGQWIETNYTKEDTFIGVEANPTIYERVKERYSGFSNVEIIHRAVSDRMGEVDFYPELLNENQVASTASVDWINASRFTGVCSWPNKIIVECLTLDYLIYFYGEPEHIKIDVEGYELTVLKGLTRPVKSLSFEWAEEQKEDILKSVVYLRDLGYEKFDYIFKDTYDYFPTDFIDSEEIINFVNELKPERKEFWGMIYAYL